MKARLWVLLVVACGSSVMAGEAMRDSAGMAAEIPIADVHFHIEMRFSPPDIVGLLDRNNVRWAGAVGPITVDPDRGNTLREVFRQVLGERYIATRGQPEMHALFLRGGISALEDAAQPEVQKLLDQAEEEFKAGHLKGFGELHVNTTRSMPNPKLRRKHRADAPSMRALYALAGRYDGFLQIHMQSDADSVQQLEALVSIEPRVPVIMAHCGIDASAQRVRDLLARHENLFCELSQKYPPVWKPRSLHERVFDDSGIRAPWRQLIEDYPDRFMVGTDAYCCDYSEAIAMLRRGLLAHLTPATMRKVAYENAQRVMKLK